MSVTVVKYNAGNVQSVIFALQRLGVDAKLSDSPEEILAAEKVIFPGVGNAESAMAYLREKGLCEPLKRVTKPFLGICLGLQLMCNGSEEGDSKTGSEGLGIFDVEVKKFDLDFKVPHMGWNTSRYSSSRGILSEVSEDDFFYYVHSYYAELGEETVGVCKYGIEFSSVLEKGNYFATQFHPEKSASVGEKLLEGFLEL